MGRPKHASNFKPQAKTADVRRVTPGALAHYQVGRPGQQLYFNHAQKFDTWSAELTAKEHYEGSFPTLNLPTPSEALMDSATAFLNDVLSDLQAMDVPMLPSSMSTNLMDCDPTPDELMNVDDEPGLDYMDVISVVPDIDASLVSAQMDVTEDCWSVPIVPVLPSPSLPPSFPAFTNYPVTPPQICQAASHCNLSAELSLTRRELAAVADVLQRFPVWTLQSPVHEPSTDSSVQKIPDATKPTNGLLLAPATISSGHLSPEHRGLCNDSPVDDVVEGIRILDISDDPAPVWNEEPIALTPALPEIPPVLLLSFSESSEPSQELDTFGYVDLLGIDSAEPLHSPVHGENGKSLEPHGIWADIADLQDLYFEPTIRDLYDDSFIAFPSSLVQEVVDIFDLPLVDYQLRLAEVTDVLSCSEANADEPVEGVFSDINNEGASADTPCESSTGNAVTVPDTVLCEAKIEEDGKLGSRISFEHIVHMMKIRAERDAKKKARGARVKEKKRRKAVSRSISEPCSPCSPSSYPLIKINASTFNPSSISAPPSPGPVKADMKNAVSAKRDNSNMDISIHPTSRNSRLSSPHKPIQRSRLKGTPFSPSVEIGKENTPSIKLRTLSSPSTNQSATKEKIRDTKPAALSPLSKANQNIQSVLPNIPTWLRSSINKESIPAGKQLNAVSLTIRRSLSSPNSSFNEAVSEDPKKTPNPRATPLLPTMTTAIEPTTTTSETDNIYLPHTHSLMRQRNMRLTAPKAPSSCSASTEPSSEFFTPKGKYLPRRSTPYPRLKYSPESKKSSDGTLSCSETPDESHTLISIDTTEGQPVINQEMVLSSAIHSTPEWIVTDATKEKVLPGAVPTADYHEDADYLPSRTVSPSQPTLLERCRIFLFGW